MKKYLPLIVFFFFLFGMSYGQEFTPVKKPTVYGMRYIYAPSVIAYSDGTLKVSGDSITAIKQLLKEIGRIDSVNDSRARYMWNVINDLTRERRAIMQGLKEIQQIIKQP